MLALLDFNKVFIMEIDTCDVSDATMQQIAYVNKALVTRAKSFSTYEKEMLTIMLAI